MRVLKYIPVLGLIFLFGCGGGALSVEEMLEHAGISNIPPAEEYEEYGAVILYEDTHTQFQLDGNWEIYRTQKYHIAFVYYNDKAEDLLTQSIYLDGDRTLSNFMARTIRPDGTVQELTEDDLIRTQLKEEFVEFSDDESVKFTFSGVSPGSIIELSYEITIFDSFNYSDVWYVQQSVPKLYTKYAVQIPTIFIRNKINWNYNTMNFELARPQVLEDIVNKTSRKDDNKTYFWELRNIEPFEYEPNRPPYDDAAKYVVLGIQRESWNVLSESYWKRIGHNFDPEKNPGVKELAKSIVGDETDETEIIRKLYNYTQKNFRYVAINIDESGYYPNSPNEIVTKKYGDCKDMSVLNVVLLKSLGLDARPVLVKTKGAGKVYPHIREFQFNHMIARVVTSDEKIYYLDAVGSSCPIDELYSSVEGTTALILNEDGTSTFTELPKSKSRDNKLARSTVIKVSPDGSITGHTKMVLTGNENLSFRSSLKDATKSDMEDVIESYVNANTADVEVFNITYDDPSEIKNDITVEFDFKNSNYAMKSNNLLMINPFIFQIDSDLDRYRDEDRIYPIMFYAPHETFDEIKIEFSGDELEFASMDKSLVRKYEFGKVSCYSRQDSDNSVNFERRVVREVTKIYPEEYQTYREYLKNINQTNRMNLALNAK
ncbi:MAG: hypothetical protein SCALA702_03940 [Melioribacteraceae bacterium]|nr:MAG: hypothetical protein SCALA702_03940 [Melioribacteraceae bacterium]